MNYTLDENILSQGIGFSTFLTLMAYFTFIILGPEAYANMPLIIGTPVTALLVIYYIKRNYSRRKALSRIGLGIFLAIIYLITLTLFGISMIRSVLSPPY